METLYLICAVLGGSVLVLQVVLMLVGGLDGDLEVESDGADDGFFKILSLKTVVAFLAFFGVAGSWGTAVELAPTRTLLIAVAAGSVALILVAWLMAGLARLQTQGNVDLRRAVGRGADVYLSVPAGERGRGKVIVEVQGRRLECKALTRGGEIPTGARARVVSVVGPDVLEVEFEAESSKHMESV